MARKTLIKEFEMGRLKNVSQLTRAYWEQANPDFMRMIDSLPSPDRKDRRILLLCLPDYPFKEDLWLRMMSEDQLSISDLMGLVKFVPEVAEAAARRVLESDPDKRQLKIIMMVVPSLFKEALRLLLKRGLSTNDLVFLLWLRPEITTKQIRITPEIIEGLLSSC